MGYFDTKEGFIHMPNEKQTLEEFLSTIENEETRKAFQSLVDRERTAAATTARKNAAKDETFLAGLAPMFKEKFEKEANMTAEQKFQAEKDALEAEKRSLQTEKNRILAEKRIAKELGLTDDKEISSIVDLVVHSDAETTEQNLLKYISVMKPMADRMAQAKIDKELGNYPSGTNQSNGKRLSEADVLKQQYQDALKNNYGGDGRDVARIIREAAEKGIQL